MPFALSPAAQQIAKRYTGKQREFLYALVSCPYPITVNCLRAVVKRFGMTYAVGQKLVDQLFEQRILQGRHPNLCDSGYASYYYYGACELSPFSYVAICSLMGPDDVKTLSWKSIYCESRSYSSLYEPEDYAWFLLRIVSPQDSFPKKPNGASDTESDRLIDAWSDHLLLLTVEPFAVSFFGTLSTQAAERLARYLQSFFSCGISWDRLMTLRSSVQAMRLTSEQRSQLDDWFTFLQFFREGHPDKLLERMRPESQHYFLMQAVRALLAGDGALAVRLVKKALKADVFFLGGLQGVFENLIYGLALYADRQSPGSRRTMESILRRGIHEYVPSSYVLNIISAVALHADYEKSLNGLVEVMNRKSMICRSVEEIVAFAFHVDFVVGQIPEKQVLRDIDFAEQSYPLIGQLWHAVMYPTDEKNVEYEKQLAVKSLIACQRRTEAWESALDELLDVMAASKKKNGSVSLSGPSARVIYLLDTKTLSIVPRLQKTKNGRVWSTGRDISLKKFRTMTTEDGLTAQDMEVASQVRIGEGRFASSYLGGADPLRQLVGHPHVYDRYDEKQRIDVLKGQLQLVVEHKNGSYTVQTNLGDDLRISDGVPDCVIRQPTQTSIEVIDISPEQQKIIATFSKIEAFPDAAKDKLTTLLERISERTPVMAELLKNSENLEKAQGSSAITVRIAPDNEGKFTVHAAVRPLAGASVLCEPGKGLSCLAMNVKNRAVQVERNLEQERKNFAQLETAVENLDDSRSDRTTWILSTVDCLEFLNAVRELSDVVVEWPEGAKLSVTHSTISFANMKFSVHRMGSWFEADGEVKLDGKTQLKMAELLRLVREAKGNFIALGKEQYVALTESLKKQLIALDRIAGGSKTVQLSPFNSTVVGELEKNGASVRADKEFRSLQERIARAQVVQATVPETLQAELRDYQTDGFEWMMRLASWGAGAVLADDMGLGKTVQTIAVLLARAALGPQLVVVPASVLFNWQEELSRFAPSLKRVILNEQGNREQALKDAGKNTVVITTYGLSVIEAEAISEKTWATAVYDEAHNIKNRETKSFKAALEVKADFRILLTGTPLQNHLAEIWALFEVAVPGLLGSFNRFADRFVLPIERDKDREQQRLLKRLISPFILRRTKADVLNELPEKTETTIKVTLSPEERALYEQLREETQINLQTGEINPIQALASLMKLRQAACSPELVDSKLRLPSSKTQAFLGLVHNLMENRHRALVFSQFTGHLALIRRALEQEGIAYLYLDGAVTSSRRQKLVEEFEQGEMPLFLISLKAGGTGLNLTAADYVIHLDPWWNPAVEDQASDRAYRIGQERPVTVYRLIAADTVEEKILKLHGTKKSLADALLEGTELSRRLGREEIMELLALAQ